MNSSPRVIVESGILEGSVCENEADPGREYCSFQGIPYAQPPIGELRFKAPRPVQPWKGIRKAKGDGDQCFSRNMMEHRQKLGSENCLFLNVYTNKLPEVKVDSKASDLRPVMLFIHGGAYTTGSNSKLIYGPDFLLRDDVVLVVINYRLGLLGFLNFQDTTLGVPGNAAFKDMVLALKWVQKNIENFNGDPNNVTIFGESAGAASVHLLALSPMTKGLFHKAIAQSGCSLSLWAAGAPSGPLVAEALGMEKHDERALLQRLKSMPVEELHKLQEKLPDPWDVSALRPIGFTIENLNQEEEPFLTEDPKNLLQRGNFHHIPFLLGFNSREGMLVHAGDRIPFKKLTPNIEHCIPRSLKLKKGSVISKEVARKIMDFYFDGKDPDKSDIDLTYKLWSDNFFIRDIYHVMNTHSKTSSKPTYAYEMTIETSINLFKVLSGITIPGVCHADDVSYLFRTAVHGELEPNSPEDIGVRRFCRWWTNFAKYGNPNSPSKDTLIPVTWKPYTPEDKLYMEIGEDISLKSKPVAERMKFWEEIFSYKNTVHKL